jgi:hypothetical protein
VVDLLCYMVGGSDQGALLYGHVPDTVGWLAWLLDLEATNGSRRSMCLCVGRHLHTKLRVSLFDSLLLLLLLLLLLICGIR